ncbi:MAG: hypothetical protein KBD56_09605 [Candidatus Eisenbacteria bacterium]|nr:hypothetical protein [Candidatus Eisenbacteria bacterium]
MITIQGWVSISGGGQIRASKRRSSLAIHSANKFRAFLILGCLVALADGPVRASVHDIAGRRVRSICDFNFAAGSHEVFWDGNDDDGRAAPAGIYLVRIAGPEATMTARFLMIR